LAKWVIAGKGKVTKNYLYIFIASVAFTTLLIGCTYTGAIRTDIAPTALVGRKYQAKVAVYFAPRLANYIETAKPATMGSVHTYQFQMGLALTSALTRSVEAAYANVLVVPSPTPPRDFERVFRFDVQSSNVRIELVPGFWSDLAKSDCVLHVSMEIADGTSFKAIQRLSVNGNGFSNKETSGGDDAQRQFSLAIEDAIRQLTEKTANILISGVGEPR
jgi:xanthine/uracil/vitamin C permease (AzgA family)